MNKKKIISKTYYKIFEERKHPDFLFLVLEFHDENEGNIIKNVEVEERSFKNRIIYNRKIIEFLKQNLILFNEEYKLAGFIIIMMTLVQNIILKKYRKNINLY